MTAQRGACTAGRGRRRRRAKEADTVAPTCAESRALTLQSDDTRRTLTASLHGARSPKGEHDVWRRQEARTQAKKGPTICCTCSGVKGLAIKNTAPAVAATARISGVPSVVMKPNFTLRPRAVS